MVVIGVGNPLRGDDAAGIAVVRRLRPRSGVRVLQQDGEAATLVEALRDASAALVVDAASGAAPGKVWLWNASAQPLPQGLLGCSTHGLGVAEGIELARALGEMPQSCLVYALEGACFETGAAMSEAAQNAVTEAVSRIEAELDAMGHADSRSVMATSQGCGRSAVSIFAGLRPRVAALWGGGCRGRSPERQPAQGARAYVKGLGYPVCLASPLEPSLRH